MFSVITIVAYASCCCRKDLNIYVPASKLKTVEKCYMDYNRHCLHSVFISVL